MLLAVLIVFTAIWWIADPRTLAPGRGFAFWLAVVGFWIVPQRFVPLYLLAGGVAFAVIAVAIVTTWHAKAGWYIPEILSATLASGALFIGSVTSFLLLRRGKRDAL